VSELTALIGGRFGRPFCRTLWFLLLWPFFLLWQGSNFIGFLLDELLFSRYRNVQIKAPVFILGPPRSGTTHMHRVLAESDDHYSTPPAWEVLLAPSIVQKKFYYAWIRLDRRIGRPFARSFSFVETRLLKPFLDTHPGSLNDPEEDYFYLSGFLCCTGWILAFPHWKGIRRLMPGCTEVSDEKRRASLTLYKRCLQKQVMVHGVGKTILSKNASFSSWLDLLPDFFPDARFVICMRSPTETVPSMLSTADEALKGFFAEGFEKELHPILIKNMQAHYQVLLNGAAKLAPAHRVVIGNVEMKNELDQVFEVLRTRLGLSCSESFSERLPLLAEKSKAHQSVHRYQTEDYDLDVDALLKTCPMLPTTLQEEMR